MSSTRSDLQITRTGITGDWFNEPLVFGFTYEMEGVGAVAERLCQSPMLTYEGRMQKYLNEQQDNPDYCAQIRAMYEITDENRDVVGKINASVSLFNRAAREGRLTDWMYKRLYSRLLRLRGM